MPQTLTRPNRYAAECIRCGGRIRAGEGLLVRTDNGGWAADHPADCPPKLDHAPEPVRHVTEDGIYRRSGDGVVFKVQTSRDSHRQYAKRLTIITTADGTPKGSFAYEAGAIHTLRHDERLTVEQAAELGAKWAVCIVCGAHLENPTSVELGIGPVCRARWFA